MGWIERLILDVQEEIEGKHQSIQLLASHRRRIATAIKEELLRRLGEKVKPKSLKDKNEIHYAGVYDYEEGWNAHHDHVTKILEG